MIAILIDTLFAASALVAVLVIAATLRRYGPAAMGLRAALARMDAEGRDAGKRFVRVTPRCDAAPARIIRPDFQRLSPYRHRHPLRAAA